MANDRCAVGVTRDLSVQDASDTKAGPKGSTPMMKLTLLSLALLAIGLEICLVQP